MVVALLVLVGAYRGGCSLSDELVDECGLVVKGVT